MGRRNRDDSADAGIRRDDAAVPVAATARGEATTCA